MEMSKAAAGDMGKVDALLEALIAACKKSEGADGEAIRAARQLLVDSLSTMLSERERAVVLPREPKPGLLMSMAMRFDHALAMPGYYDVKMFGTVTHAQRLQATLSQMRQLYEEASGNGFYRPELEDDYVNRMRECSAEPRYRGAHPGFDRLAGA